MVLSRLLLPALLAALLIGALPGTTPPVQASTTTAQARSVIDFARAQIGKRYMSLGSGPAAYDCVGLVWRSFRENGIADRIGGRRSPSGYFTWFRQRGLVTRNPRPGDLVVWGSPPSHVGIYTGTRNGQAMTVSALVGGIKEHRVHGVTTPFKAYLRVSFNGAP
jgi:peptidoglycan DL-endopeptidase CwlO